MPSTPTTKSQVQAYRFVLRRMQSALVRKDAVMLHDPMRTHSRATAVGVVISALGLLGFLVVGMLSPKGGGPDPETIVVGEQSGAMYIATGDPMQLIPTFNLASARLLMAAQQQQSQEGEGGGTAGSGEVKEPEVVSDEELEGIPKQRPTGIPTGPSLLPTDEQRISNNWAVCDKITVDRSLDNPADTGAPTTTVLGGIDRLGDELGSGQALLAHAENNKVYLIYRVSPDPNRGNTNVVRAEVNMSDAQVTSAFNLETTQQREISMGLLNSIPQAEPLSAPQIDGAGSPSEYLGDLQIGDVFLSDSAGSGNQHWVVLPSGVQDVPESLAQLVRNTYQQTSGRIPRLQPSDFATAPRANELESEDYPEQMPQIIGPERTPVSCLGWSVEGEGEQRDTKLTMHIGGQMPRDNDGSGIKPLPVGQPGPSGAKIDSFYMPQGKAAVVHAATSRDSFQTGPIYLVSDRGVKFGVPDVRTAQILGLNNRSPAPSAIMSLLPDGASLNMQDAQQTYDSVELQSGAAGLSGAQGGG